MSEKTYNDNFTEIFPDDKLFVDKQTKIRGNFYVKNYIDFTNEKTSFIVLRKNGKIYRINANLLYYLGNVDYCIKTKFDELEKKIEYNNKCTIYNNKCNKYSLNKINNLKREIKCIKKQISTKADKPMIALIKGILVFINNFCVVKDIFVSRIIIFVKFITLITKIIFKK